jgi:periplasmic protein TonB
MSGFALNGAALARHENRLPALAVALLAHVGLLALLILAPSQSSMLPVGSSVPINIVSSAPATDSRPAIQASETVAAAAPQPQPQAPQQPPAPEIATPSFSASPNSSPKPAKPTPAQPSLNPTHPTPSNVDWARMQQIIDAAKRNAGAQASGAARGPSRVETATQARPDAGQGVSQSDILGLQQLLDRLWNLQCDVAGVSGVPPFKVRFIVGLSGRLIGDPNAGGLEQSSNPLAASVARRAIDAIRQAEPLAAPYYGQTITVNFDAKEACRNR